jgi:hypothetical protein
VTRGDREDSPADLVLAARRAGVTGDRVLAAIRATPRAAFVPAGYVAQAYADRPLPIPHGQVTTQPSLSAAMIAGLGLGGGEQVLEIGTGYGYQAGCSASARMSASATSTPAKLAALTRKHTPTPAAAMSTPATAGPMAREALVSTLLRLTASCARSRTTISGHERLPRRLVDRVHRAQSGSGIAAEAAAQGTGVSEIAALR